MADATTKDTLIGATFRSIIADANVLWKVIEKHGRNAWLCRVEPNEIEFAGREDYFSTEDIEGRVAMEQMWEHAARDRDIFWENQPVGKILHVVNGRNEFIRGSVVDDPEHGRAFRAEALVGEWHSSSLPFRFKNGNPHCPYFPNQVLNRHVYRPQVSNIFEARPHAADRTVDPYDYLPINLTLPDPTPAEQRSYEMHQAAEAVTTLLNDGESPIEERLRLALAKLETLDI